MSVNPTDSKAVSLPRLRHAKRKNSTNIEVSLYRFLFIMSSSSHRTRSASRSATQETPDNTGPVQHWKKVTAPAPLAPHVMVTRWVKVEDSASTQNPDSANVGASGQAPNTTSGNTGEAQDANGGTNN